MGLLSKLRRILGRPESLCPEKCLLAPFPMKPERSLRVQMIRNPMKRSPKAAQDGATLTFTAASGDPSVAEGVLKDGTLYVIARGAGETKLTVTARTEAGEEAAATVSVKVRDARRMLVLIVLRCAADPDRKARGEEAGAGGSGGARRKRGAEGADRDP